MRPIACALFVLGATGDVARAEPSVASSTEPPPAADTAAEASTPPPAPPPPLPHEHTAAEVYSAPLPGDESGRTDVVDPGDSFLRTVGRGALFVPKLAVEAALLPVDGAIWANDRYQLEDLYYVWLFNADRTIGAYPTATYETGFGATLGARFEDRDVFGEKELVGVQATSGAATGEEYRESFLVQLRSGDRIARWFRLGVDANFDRRPADPFFGIGNGNLTTTLPAMPVDPLTNTTAVETYNRYQEKRVSMFADATLTRELHVRGTGSLTALDFADSAEEAPAVSTVYNTAGVVGFDSGVHHAYGELELRWDSRRRFTPWEPHDVHSAGSLVAAFAGRVDRIDGEGADFWRYGTELQHYIRLANGPRVLALRFRLEGVTGAIDQVPFTELPMLGGGTFLRGYSFERFRDRIASFGSVQYQWDLSHLVDAYLFTDVGRVYPSLDELTLDDLRVGFGGGFEVHSDHGFLVDISLASSIDGGLFTSFTFNPVPDARQRWR
jgi:hypothetical protein